jgi:hypothetical protein
MPYATPTREGDVIHTIRIMGRLAQMLLDLRDEYERRPSAGLVDEIDRRIGELAALRDDLHGRPADGEPTPTLPPTPATET